MLYILQYEVKLIFNDFFFKRSLYLSQTTEFNNVCDLVRQQILTMCVI